MNLLTHSTASVILGLASVYQCTAATTTFTDDTAFFSAISGFSSSTLDFESQSDGDIISSGDTVDGITFDYDFGGVEIQVGNTETTVSGTNYLGTNDGDIFQDGDDFDLSFAASNALGLFFITADELFDDDIMLSIGSATASLIALDLVQTLSDGSDVFFLGIVDTMNTFSTASITTVGGGFFLYNVDDITTAAAEIVVAPVPEPGTIWLLALGTLLIARKNFLSATSRSN